jgi:multiple sugar transport system ATP-binding protein
MVYVTHDQVEAMTLGQRIAVLNRGELEQVADPQTLYDAPATPFVAGFIGSPPMNLFEARLKAMPGGGWSVNIAGERVAVIGADELRSVDGGLFASGADTRLIAGIRPEHLQPATDTDAGFAFTVAASEYLGHETLIHGHPGTGEASGKPWIVRLPGMRVLPPGESLQLACPAARHVRLFPEAGSSV